jgi:prophage regulatory protein
MRELPRRTRGVVSVQSLDRRPPSVDTRTISTPVVSGPNADAVRGAIPKLLRFPAVRERTGLSRSTIWRLERRGEFPKHHRISPNIVAWVEEDVTNWIELKRGSVAS